MSQRWAVDAIWLSPFFTSPMKDFGYDVADYCGVDPVFGTLADFDALVARAHALGLKVIIDQVYSHSSDQHPWFQESRSVATIREPTGTSGPMPSRTARRPTTGSRYSAAVPGPGTRGAGQYYLHNFLQGAAATSTCTIAKCRTRCSDVARFWLDRGRRRVPHRRDQLRDARPGAAGQSAGAHDRRSARGRSTSSISLQPVASGHRAVPRAAAGADRQLRRALHPGRSRRRACACRR